MARMPKKAASMPPESFKKLIKCLEGNRAAHLAYQPVFDKRAETIPAYASIAAVNRETVAGYDKAIEEARKEYAKGGRK